MYVCENKCCCLLLSPFVSQVPISLLLFHSPRNGPLFLLELNLGPSGVQYNVELSLFESTLVGLFDKGIQVTHSIPQLEKVRFYGIGSANDVV